MLRLKRRERLRFSGKWIRASDTVLAERWRCQSCVVLYTRGWQVWITGGLGTRAREVELYIRFFELFIAFWYQPLQNSTCLVCQRLEFAFKRYQAIQYPQVQLYNMVKQSILWYSYCNPLQNHLRCIHPYNRLSFMVVSAFSFDAPSSCSTWTRLGSRPPTTTINVY